MFKKFSKKFLILFSSCLLVGSSGVHHGDNDKLSHHSEVVTNVHSSLSSIEKSVRKAAVKVEREDGGYGSAAHVVGDFKTVSLIGQSSDVVKGSVIYRHNKRDIAFILPEKNISSRNPVQFKPINRRKSQIGNKITYTGFPNRHNLLTIRGAIAGYDSEEDVLLIQSFAWMGSSGSGVFDLSGKFIGVVSAIDVGVAYYPQLIETMVWI